MEKWGEAYFGKDKEQQSKSLPSLTWTLSTVRVTGFHPNKYIFSLHVLVTPGHKEPLDWSSPPTCSPPMGIFLLFPIKSSGQLRSESFPPVLILQLACVSTNTFCLLADGLLWKFLNPFYFPNLCELFPESALLSDLYSPVPLGLAYEASSTIHLWGWTFPDEDLPLFQDMKMFIVF